MSEISYQLYSSREFPPVAGTLRMLRSLGYSHVEGYAGLFDDIAGLKAGLDETGLSMPSSHFGLDMLENDVDKVLEMAATLGIGSIFCPHIIPDLRPADSAGWRDFGARLEVAGAPLKLAGLEFGWHNHDFEFAPLGDGTAPMQHLLEGGPSLSWEADIAWIVRGGADPLAWIDRYGDRIRAVHVKDIAPAGKNDDEDGWADVGHGTMNWRGLLGALQSTAAEIFVLEHDRPNDHERFARRSIEALRSWENPDET